MSWKKRQSPACTACHLVPLELRQFRVSWYEEEEEEDKGIGRIKYKANLVWRINESSFVQSLTINRAGRRHPRRKWK